MHGRTGKVGDGDVLLVHSHTSGSSILQPEQDAWKKAVLAREIELEDIDTEPFNVTRGRKPTQVSTKQARDMVAGVVGRPDSEALSGG